MRILILGAYHIWPMLEYELDIMQREIDLGNEVIYLKCSSNVETCPANNPQPQQVFNKIICIECKSRLQSGLNWIGSNKIKVIDFDGHISSEQKLKITNEINTLRNTDVNEWSHLISKNFKSDIYDAAKSQLMTTVRESQPNLELNKIILLSFIQTGMIAEEAANNLIIKYRPEKVYLYNGRLPRYRPLLRLCKGKNIESAVYEYPRFEHERYVVTKNTFIHDRLVVSSQIKNKPSGAITISDGEKWLSNKINRVKQSSEPVYALNQKISTLPENWKSEHFNISFFLTSEYEIAGVKEWIDTRIYNSQFDGIIKIVNALSDLTNVTFYVRVHPNLFNKDILFNKFINDISFHNLLIIPADSPIDSYELAKKSNLVISFGSTIGVEAAFMGSYVALLSAAFYSSYDCCFKPQSHDELIKAIYALYFHDDSYFPNKSKAKDEAIYFARDFINFGVVPFYLRKDSLENPIMFKDNLRYKLSAKFIHKFISRSYVFLTKMNKLKNYNNYSFKKLKSLIGTFFTQVPR